MMRFWLKILPNPKALEWQEKKDESLFVEVNQNEIEEINYQTL
jgi:hypothetical protein